MSEALADLGRGLAEPVAHAQQVFRAVLEAVARPGRVQALPPAVLQPLQPPGLPAGLTALLLSLLDAETTLWLAPPWARHAALDYLRFHSGVQLLDTPQQAAFAACEASQANAGLWSTLPAGTDEMPQLGATLLVEVPDLRTVAVGTPGSLTLRGPGIEHWQGLFAGGLAGAFWQARAEQEADYPRGIDLILCCGGQLAALPRTTRAVLEA